MNFQCKSGILYNNRYHILQNAKPVRKIIIRYYKLTMTFVQTYGYLKELNHIIINKYNKDNRMIEACS